MQHWYGNTFEDFQAHIEQARAMFPGTDMVVTEFALSSPAGGVQAQTDFYTQAFPWLDDQCDVVLYFPFVATSPSLALAHSYGNPNVDTSSCLYQDNGTPSAVGNLVLA